MLELGTPAPDFALPDVVTGRTVSLAAFQDKDVLLVMFICHHCPFVKHVKAELARFGRDYAGKSVGIVGISSNDPAISSDDSPEGLRQMVSEWASLSPCVTTRRRRWPRATPRPVHPISMSSIVPGAWPIAANSTTADPATSTQ